jgi:hypothetical protein
MDYYTQTSEMSPLNKRYQDYSYEQPAPVMPQTTTHDIVASPQQPIAPVARQQVQMPAQRPQIHPSVLQNLERQFGYNSSAFSLDMKEILKRALKYLVEGLSVALVAYYFTKGKLDTKEIIMLGITAALTFAILDAFAPTVSLGVRLGAGFGVGQTMFGLNPTLLAAPMI